MVFINMVNTMQKSAGLILAGGRSSRMGQDKSRLLLAQGSTLLENSICLLKESGLSREQIYISGKDCSPDSVADIVPGKGPLGGIYSVIRYFEKNNLNFEHILVMPVDTPFLTPELLTGLLRFAQTNQNSNCYYVESTLPAVFRMGSRLYEAIHLLVKDEEERCCSLRSLHSMMGSTTVEAPAGLERHFMNLNSSSEWKEFFGKAQQKSCQWKGIC